MRWLKGPELFESPDEDTLNWLNLVMVAKWAGVEPWELAKQPAVWLDVMNLSRDAEMAQIKTKK
ncbi:MAG: hypothetical protein LLG42_16280 [Chloroflexi bacterium]|nr:hypothetical protein [Chloroflexota bacterium]